MPETNWTHDIPVEIDALLDRLRRCDGKSYDATVVVWEQCQMLAAEVERLRSEADLYRRGYEAMGAADISEFLALCGAAKTYHDALDMIEQVGHNPADLAPDLIGKPDRYEQLADILTGMAMKALNGGQ